MDVVRGVLRPNSEPKELFDWWIEGLRSAGKAQARHWCVLGQYLECWSIVDVDTVKDLLGREEVPSSSVITGLLLASRMDILESAEELFEGAVEAILTGERVGSFQSDSLLKRLALSLERTSIGGHNPRSAVPKRVSLLEYLSKVHGHEGLGKDIASPNYAMADRCVRLVQAFTTTAQRPLGEWERFH